MHYFFQKTTNGKNEIVGFASFYTLPSTVMHHPTYKSIKAAYAFYNVGSKDVSLQNVMQDALTVAKNVIISIFTTPVAYYYL